MQLGIPKEKIQAALDNIGQLSPKEQRELLTLIEQYEAISLRHESSTNFLRYVKHMWPEFIEGHHHTVMADAFDRVLNGECKRLIINMAPRHTKSEFASIHLPSYFIGKNPNKKIIQATHTAELAVGFGRKVRSLIGEDGYKEVFPGVDLSVDSKAAGRWATSKGGEYFAIGVGGAVAGRGADLLVIDDPVDEQTAQYGESNPDVYEKVYDWYTLLRQRLQPGGAIIIVMTRWSKRDLTGRLIRDMTEREGSDQWEVIELPAILPSGQPMWPAYWKIEELEKTKASIPLYRWNAQYQQDPTSEESSLLKREYWKRWESINPPDCELVMVSWDTAFEKTERANYSACTTWGVFTKDDEVTGKSSKHIILLDAFRGKWHFPELKAIAKKHYNDRQPDIFLVEAKAAGGPLVQEMRSAGIPVQAYTPVRGTAAKSNDKIARANAVTDILASGIVYAPHTRWAEEVIEECAEFPVGEYDDYVDTVTQALLRFRKGGFIQLHTDDSEEDHAANFMRKVNYY